MNGLLLHRRGLTGQEQADGLVLQTGAFGVDSIGERAVVVNIGYGIKGLEDGVVGVDALVYGME